MSGLPSSLALNNIADGSNIVAADHRNNYAAIQAAVNALIAALGGGSAGQVLQALTSSSVAWGGSVKVATTVAGLGTGVDGEAGLIRGGSSPYDIVPVVYDATYGKWVSQPFALVAQMGSWNTTDGVTVERRIVAGGAGNWDADYAHLSAKALTDAGLRLQVRLVGEMLGSASVAANCIGQVDIVEANVGDTGAGSVFSTSVSTALSQVNIGGVANNTWKSVDGGWAQAAAATKSLWRVILRGNVGAAMTHRMIVGVQGRWVG
jgi:hypothetical protein